MKKFNLLAIIALLFSGLALFSNIDFFGPEGFRLSPGGGFSLSPGSGFTRTNVATTSVVRQINLDDSFLIGTSTPETSKGILTVALNGSTTIRTPINSEFGFRVQNSAYEPILHINTQNGSTTVSGRLNVGGIVSSGILGLGTSTPSKILSVSTTATTTIYFDSTSATQGACIKIKNATGTGYTFMTVGYGVATFSTEPCE